MLQLETINRFGWGIRPQEQPQGTLSQWLSSQLQGPDAASFPGVSSCADGLIALRQQRMDKMQGDPLVKPIFLADASAQLNALLTTQQPFRERLAWFWFNHFTVSMRQGGTRGIVGAYMREAIRPHVTGRFTDMLAAVMSHPAMLMYLDNASSIGPNSPAGQKRHRGLNENLARECLELHTVSPKSGYTQADVTAFAAILTGWSVDMKADEPGFTFRDNAHEPGEKTVMGQVFPEGLDGGIQAIQFLGTHPATYRHIATQLVTHFISDTPSEHDINYITTVLHDTQGDLGAASLALGSLSSAEQPTAGKFRSPMDYATAVMRALSLGNKPDQDPTDPHSAARTLLGAYSSLGQPLWTAPLPNGWSDLASDWSSPADLLARTDWSWRLSAHAHTSDPLEIANATLGPALRKTTYTAMRTAGSRQDALTLLFSSPEFQRR
ncbi:DUF1800 domain-containing protein [Acetobacter orientalis]|uniref:DUF1800 domain-containing protein n=3 Tax=Acetobacter orientalis TaxID=146474 RepID=A0A252A1H1_9PROT|nr:DUF1800 domain-containing protein [Acetobacter orientalis]MDN6042092.1 DUF1800 domain-containing protein [Acetobacter sp.]MCP1222046.1 DUF1800 domain-containing protein [Acetobacter orientalis]OUI81215.1 hypothetical protein HK12_05630 [Acetobacter orientalis]BBC78428.1 hypothetical protein Abor_024_028 [Acetobacter orientalis]GAN66584.1 hypothetical protein Abor_024_028 [Acetobacter orientalis]